MIFSLFIVTIGITKKDGGVTDMAYVITDECVMCGSCAGACPVGCISEGDTKYVIDKDACAGCGECASSCPVEAIVEE